jgi:hypothetical protein
MYSKGDGGDVHVSPAVNDDVVPAAVPDAAEISVRGGRAIRLDAQKLLAGDQQASVGQPVDRPTETVVRPDGINPGRADAPNYASAVQLDRNDLAGRPVGEPETALVPAGRLDHGKAVQEHLRLT